MDYIAVSYLQRMACIGRYVPSTFVLLGLVIFISSRLFSFLFLFSIFVNLDRSKRGLVRLVSIFESPMDNETVDSLLASDVLLVSQHREQEQGARTQQREGPQAQGQG